VSKYFKLINYSLFFIFSFFISTASHADALAQFTPVPQLTPSIAFQNYFRLKQMLAAYEAATAKPWPILQDDRALKRGSRSKRVILLRERLRRTSDLTPQDDIGGEKFDAQLADAVAVFQSRHGLRPDGVAGKNTILELNVSPENRAKQIKLNMARWYALISQLGNRYILVNIPDYRLTLFENNQQTLTMKVIVGKPDWPTPELTSMITRLILNPYWDVPDLIARKDLVPKIIEDPNYLNAMEIKIFEHQEDNARQLSVHEIDWDYMRENGFPYHFRQEPGPKNSLGLVKFEFENKYHIYLHDTPAKDLFDRDERDLSHGCVRLEDPFALVTYFLKDHPTIDDMRIQDILAAGKTKYIRLPQPIPIIITYITAWVDDAGVLQFRDDIYQHDNIVTQAMRKTNTAQEYREGIWQWT